MAVKKDIKESTEKILNSNDKLVKKLDTFLIEKTVIGRRVDEHEQRIRKLELR